MKTENRQRFLVILMLSALGLFVADRVVFGPLTKSWKERSERIADLRKQVGDGSLLLQRENSLRARWSQMSTNTLPANPSLAEQQLLKAVDVWAQESHVSVTGITPQWKSDEDDHYQTLDCQVDTTGDLDALSRFLYNLGKNPMALKLESVELTSHDNTGQELAMGLRISGLVLTPDGQPQ
jgi:Tfp pilus assembly protein PilO